MSGLTIESLGISTDELTQRLVQTMADRLLGEWADDDEGKTTLHRRLEKLVIERVDQAIEDLAGRHVLPNVAQYVETLVLTETNKWGEKSGRSLTFVEYLVERAEHYLTEKVDYKGKAKGEEWGSSWSPHQTRVSHLVHEHLQYSIKTAMEQALKTANSKIAEGIQETVKIKLAEIVASLKVEAKIGR